MQVAPASRLFKTWQNKTKKYKHPVTRIYQGIILMYEKVILMNQMIGILHSELTVKYLKMETNVILSKIKAEPMICPKITCGFETQLV